MSAIFDLIFRHRLQGGPRHLLQVARDNDLPEVSRCFRFGSFWYVIDLDDASLEALVVVVSDVDPVVHASKPAVDGALGSVLQAAIG